MHPLAEVSDIHRGELSARAAETLRIMHDWGYAPSLESLAANLVGGEARTEDLRVAIASGLFVHQDGLVCLRGREALLAASRRRATSHVMLNGHAREVAREFARDLYAACPFVRCLALSGSVASGGYRAGDDIDFDLFVEDGTKYVSYLLAILVGLKYSWRYRNRPADRLCPTPLLPKVTCVNVVWEERETRPFTRQDAGMAFELSRCQTLYGSETFREVLRSNQWVRAYFPQLFERAWVEGLSLRRGLLGRVLERLATSRVVRRGLDLASMGLSWALYHIVQRSRRRNPEAAARIAFLRRVKYPYEIFQKTG